MTEELGIVYSEDGRLLFKNELGEVFAVKKVLLENEPEEDL